MDMFLFFVGLPTIAFMMMGRPRLAAGFLFTVVGLVTLFLLKVLTD